MATQWVCTWKAVITHVLFRAVCTSLKGVQMQGSIQLKPAAMFPLVE